MTRMFIEAPHGARSNRARRMFDALLRGAAPEAISEEEGLPQAEVEASMRDELGRRRVTPAVDFAKIQIARLERLCLAILDKAHRGELKAVDRALKILDRLDRYHGFTRAAPAAQPYGDEERERLLAKLNAIAARLDADDSGA
jgi:hypothetical protein